MRVSESNHESVASQQLLPERGLLTWNAEGESTGRYATRKIHWPGGKASGVTIGRGYDMGLRSAADVQRDLIAAGVSRDHAIRLGSGAGKRGDAAANFVRSNRSKLPELTPAQELKLFSSVTYPRYEREVQRISAKADVVSAYGRLDFDSTPQAVRDVIVDLAYTGNYTPGTRKFLQQPIVSGDREEICAAFQKLNEHYGVPRQRAALRNAVLDCARD